MYFGLDPDQRIDVQLISNTNIAVSTDLFDRMRETLFGPELRNWCQQVGLLAVGQDFADKRGRASPLTVRAARSFIFNYYLGRNLDPAQFDETETIPVICKSGVPDVDWEALKKKIPKLWVDAGLKAAGIAFSALIAAQRKAYASSSGREGPSEYRFCGEGNELRRIKRMGVYRRSPARKSGPSSAALFPKRSSGA